MKGQVVGYIRVSSVLQNTDRQLDGLELDQVFTDKLSGKDADRPALQEMIRFVRNGDTVMVHSIDRLARNLQDLKEIVKTLNDKGVTIKFVKEGLVFGIEKNNVAELMINIMGAFAEFERTIINERQREGVQLAKAQGKYKGRKRSLTDEQIATIRERAASGDSKTQIAADMGVSRETVYQYLRG